ncbi:MAG: hypothetical protein HY879_03405 [Deltaproteobacteria bacterium]|nr:hypothetical protein [Deltaproteobacteria bacterium]
MKCLEIINLRASGDVRELFNPEMTKLFNRISQLNGLIEFKLFFHAFVSNDLAVHLLWDTEAIDPRGSPLGRQLVQILRDFGLTNYNLWKEEERK